MAASSRDDLRRLHFIDTLFAHVTGHDLYLANQIKSAITFSLAELEAQTAAHPEFAATYDAAFNAAAADLLAKEGISARVLDLRLRDTDDSLVRRGLVLERAQLLLESSSRAVLQAFLKPWMQALRESKSRLRWSLEVDPVDI